jgi:hypothetical protein
MVDPNLTPAATFYMAAAAFLAQLGGALWNNHKGRKRDRGASDRWEKVGRTLGALGDQVTRVEHYVVGPDGKNGIRRDLQEVKEEVKGLRERELERLQAIVNAVGAR